MAKDPTANAAARNVLAQERAAYVYHHDEHDQPARLWMDRATLATLATLVHIITDDSGERHIRFKDAS